MKHAKFYGYGIASLFLILVVFTLSGCHFIDGKVDSAVTGEYSSQQEISNEARKQASDLESEAAVIGAQSVLLQENYDSDMTAVGAENTRRNTFLTNGLGLTTSLINLAVPQAAPFIDGVLPLISDLFLIGGGAVLVHRKGKKSGANELAGNIQLASEESPELAVQITTSKRLRKLNKKASKPVQDAIAMNKVVV